MARNSGRDSREMSLTFVATEAAASEVDTQKLLHEIQRRIALVVGKGHDAKAALANALRQAEALSRSGGDCERGAEFGAIALVADALAALGLEHGWPKRGIGELIDSVAELTSIPAPLVRSAIHGRAAWNPDLNGLAPRQAVETHVRMLVALAGLGEASFWQADGLGRIQCLFRIGSDEPTRSVRAAARRTLLGTGGPAPSRGLVVSVPVLRWQRPRGALVIRTTRELRAQALALAGQTAAALAPVLERDALLERGTSKERALVASSERRLARLGFDLHDGPIQELAFLGTDTTLLRRQLATSLDGKPDADRLLGRVDDLRARVDSIDAGLRTLVHSLEAPTIGTRPLPALLEQEVASVRRYTDIDVTLTLNGDFSTLTPSQKIALARIVQEAISNIREHTRATEISISVALRRGHVHARIRDNGKGFNVERAIVRAARKGRVGLLGMSERVRLLGGRFDIDSQPGKGTEISVVFPPWQPLTQEGSGADLLTVAGNRGT